MINFRAINTPCPKCGQTRIKAIEIPKDMVSSYICENCGSNYDAVIFHDWENNKHYWLGKLRNPEFWAPLENKTFEEGLLIMEKRKQIGIKEYIETYLMEEILLK